MTTAVGPILWIAAQNGKLSDVRTLLNGGGVDLEVKSGGMSSSSLHLAAKNGHLMVLLHLIDHGADKSAVDRDGWTPLHYACFGNHESVLLTLLHHGADVNLADTNGVTPLMIAARNGSHAITEILLYHHADIDAQNVKSETALHFAAARGHETLVQLLVEDGISTDCRSIEGFTAGELASFHTHSRIATMLKGFEFRRSNQTYRVQRVTTPVEIQTPLSFAPKLLKPLMQSFIKKLSFKIMSLKRRVSL